MMLSLLAVSKGELSIVMCGVLFLNDMYMIAI